MYQFAQTCVHTYSLAAVQSSLSMPFGMLFWPLRARKSVLVAVRGCAMQSSRHCKNGLSNAIASLLPQQQSTASLICEKDCIFDKRNTRKDLSTDTDIIPGPIIWLAPSEADTADICCVVQAGYQVHLSWMHWWQLYMISHVPAEFIWYVVVRSKVACYNDHHLYIH